MRSLTWYTKFKELHNSVLFCAQNPTDYNKFSILISILDIKVSMSKIVPEFERFKRFLKRNDTLFACLGLVICGHIVWWEIQQNRNIIPKESRIKHIGPIQVPYIDDYIEKKDGGKGSK